MTFLIKPHDQSIIEPFKTLQVQQIVDAIDDGQENGNDIAKNMTMLQEIYMLHNAWTKITISCRVNGF